MNEVMFINNPMLTYFEFCIVVLIPLFQIFRRAGLSPIMIAPLFIPFAGFPIITFILAYSLWPVRGPLKLKKRNKEKKI